MERKLEAILDFLSDWDTTTLTGRLISIFKIICICTFGVTYIVSCIAICLIECLLLPVMCIV